MTLTTRNYPGRLHIPVCIIPCARYSTANRLVFHSANRQPLLPHYQGPQPSPAHHRLSTQRQQSPLDSHSIRSTNLGYSGASAPPSTKPPSTPARYFPHELGRLPCGVHIGLSHGQGAVPVVLPTPPAPCLASVATVRCKCRSALGPCPLQLPHTLVLRSKIILTPLFHVFELHLVTMGHQLPRTRILNARPCVQPSFLASPKPSIHASHSPTLLKTASHTRTPLMILRPSTRSRISSRLPIVTWLFS